MKRESFQSRATIWRGVLMIAFLVLLSGACAQQQVAVQQNGNGSGIGSGAGRKTPETKKSPQAEAGKEPEAVETRLTRLFDICKSNQFEDAASYFVYRGPDKSREWKDTLHADDPTEKGAAREICRRITGYLDESDSYSFGEVKVERESEGEWHALEVSFQLKGSGGAKKAIFAFLNINGQFAIGDID